MIVNTGLRRFTTRGSGSGANAASLDFDLVNSPSLTGNRGGTISLTRATTATYTDQDVIVRTALAGQARMQGMRVVRNLITTSSEDLRVAGNWIHYGAGSLTACTLDTSDFPTGTTQSTVFTSNTQYQGRKQAGGLTVGLSYRCRFWAKGAVGGETVWCSDSLGTGGLSQAVTTSWVLYASPVFVAAAVEPTIGISSASAATVKFSGVQWELVTGQTNQNPGEYQSVGIIGAAPYQGLGVDGSQAYITSNGNTVASGVITEATGAVISSAIRQGFLVEPAATNLALQSQDLGTTWVTGNSTVSANATTAPDGTATADKYSGDGTSNGHYVRQSVTLAISTTYTLSVYIKPAENSWLYVSIGGTGAGGYRTFNVTTGALGSLTSGLVSSSITAAANGFYRCSITLTTGGAVGSNVVEFSTSPTDSIGVNSTTGGTYAWGAQLETGSAATSYIPTTTAAVTRNASVATEATSLFPFNSAAGTIFAQYIQPVNDGLTHTVVCVDDGTANERIRISTASGTTTFLVTVGGVAKFSATIASPTAGTTVKVAMTYIANGGVAYQNGVAATIGTAGTTLPTVTTFRYGNSASISQLQSTLQRVQYAPRVLNNAFVQGMTI